MSEQEYVEDDVQDGRVVKGTRVKKMSEQEYVEDEINLRDYIKVILKRKKLILTVFLVAVITTTVVSLLLPRVYEATTSIMIMPSRLPTALSPTQISLDVLDAERERAMVPGRQVIPRPAIAIPTHKVLLKSNTVLERIIDRLKLTDQAGKSLTPDDLKGLNVKEVKGTNILRLEVERSNPRIAKEIANAWAEKYLKYSHELISEEVGGIGDFVVSQFEIVRENLIQAEEAVKDFKNEHQLDLMRAELNIKKEKLNNEKEEYLNLGLTLKTKEDSLRELKEQIENQEKFIVVSKAITDEALWEREGKGKDLSELGDRRLRSEVINPLYQSLRTRIVNTGIEFNALKSRLKHLEKSIELTGKEIDELERTINQREFELTRLTRQEIIYQRTFDNLAIRLEEARIAKAMELGEVRIISPAIEPESPIRPKKKLNVAISGVLGLMFGVFIAFSREFLEKNKTKS